MAVKGSPPLCRLGPLNVRSNLCDDGRAKGDIGHEMAVHDVDMDPVRVGAYQAGALGAQLGKVGREDGRRDNGGRRHLVWHFDRKVEYWSGGRNGVRARGTLLQRKRPAPPFGSLQVIPLRWAPPGPMGSAIKSLRAQNSAGRRCGRPLAGPQPLAMAGQSAAAARSLLAQPGTARFSTGFARYKQAPAPRSRGGVVSDSSVHLSENPVGAAVLLFSLLFISFTHCRRDGLPSLIEAEGRD